MLSCQSMYRNVASDLDLQNAGFELQNQKYMAHFNQNFNQYKSMINSNKKRTNPDSYDRLQMTDIQSEFSNQTINWRQIRGSLVFEEKMNELLNIQAAHVKYDISETDFSEYILVNNLFTADEKNKDLNLYMDATISCEGVFWINQQEQPAQQKIKFRWYNSKTNGQKIKIKFQRHTNTCEVDISKKNVIVLSPIKTESIVPDKFMYCESTKDDLIPEQIIQGCSSQISETILLDDQVESAKERFKLLVKDNAYVDQIFINKNPLFEIKSDLLTDLSLILVSYLDIRNDFYGHSFLRLLESHAKKKTNIFVIVSKALTHKKERIFLKELSLKYPNFYYKEYFYDPINENTMKGLLSKFHRNQHVKLFTVFEKENKKNITIIGGRNIHDGFLFKQPPDLSMYPDLIQYGKDTHHAYFNDLDIKIKSENLQKNYSHIFFSTWNIDPHTLYLRNPFEHSDKKNIHVENEKNMTPILSVPYQDQKALEIFYVNLFATAKNKITITSPYFRLTDPIARALIDANQRGVQIEIITRIAFDNDTFGWFTKEVNKQAVNKYYEKFKIYIYDEKNVIMHSKIILIDDNKIFLGSVNLNKRSFVYDLETGVLFQDQKISNQLNLKIINSYKEKSRLVIQSEVVEKIKQILINLVDEEF